MSQVSKIDAALNDICEGQSFGSEKKWNEAKQALLSIILEALPKKQDGSWCCHPDEDDWHHIAPKDKLEGPSECKIHDFAGGSTGDTSFNAAIDEASEQIARVFGVEG